MDIRYVVSELLSRYKKYEDLLIKETDALLSSDIEGFKVIVNDKIDLLEKLTEFEQNRVSVFGQKTLSELLEYFNIPKEDKEVIELQKTIISIQELTETSKMLMDQVISYNQAFLDAVREVSNQGTTYSKDKKPDSRGQSVTLLDKKL
jgi:flagellar biosynthesis/type III secretory pathway chaperone